jgi:hypothetical protein
MSGAALLTTTLPVGLLDPAVDADEDPAHDASTTTAAPIAIIGARAAHLIRGIAPPLVMSETKEAARTTDV